MAASEPTVLDAVLIEQLKDSKSPKIKRALEAEIQGVPDDFPEQTTPGASSPTP